MKWTKLGKVFDPTKFRLPNNCAQYAQSPQALVFDDFVRIYFSAREVDLNNGKHLSHVCFVDQTKDFKEVINVATRPVVELGEPGCFDEHGIFPMNVLRVGDRIYGYTCGWSRRVSVSVDTSIGLAISQNNGLTFRKVGSGPVLTSSLHEPFLVGDPFVRFYENVFHMWYIFGVRWKIFPKQEAPDRVYKIAHATSPDGIHWRTEDGRPIIRDKLNDDECQALPTVLRFDDRYHMFFCYRQPYDFRKSKGRGYKIGYAFSDDLLNWVREDHSAGIDGSEGEWDSEMQCYPHVFECDERIHMLYNGNEFGKYGYGVAILE